MIQINYLLQSIIIIAKSINTSFESSLSELSDSDIDEIISIKGFRKRFGNVKSEEKIQKKNVYIKNKIN